MNVKRLIGLVVATMAVVVGALVFFAPARPPARLDVVKLREAIQAFTRDRQASGRPVPDAVSLRELIAAGPLRAEDVEAFQGMEVTVALKADERQPQLVLVRAKLPDGHEMVVLNDGSVQTVRP